MPRASAAFLRCLTFAGISLAVLSAQAAPPKAGPVAIMKSAELRPGMKATAWTVFEGTQPEAIPVEIIGLWKNAWGPQQDIILGKMGGKAQRTNVAGGMSGSPVYIDGKLIGAVALRLSVFSPDAICGITPIELMLEINEIDKSMPSDARTPDKVRTLGQSIAVPNEMVQRVMAAGAQMPAESPMMVPIETPLVFAGFTGETLRQFGPMFAQMGIKAVAGGAAGAIYETKPARNWATSLQPGQPIAGVLVSGDMSVTGLGTVSYNDGKRVLGFGHPFFNLGPVTMPMSQGEILMVLASQFQPNKIGNATEIVGALKQDRHSGIMGVLGEEAPMIPVTLKLRSFGPQNKMLTQKDLRFNMFIHQKWTPFLTMIAVFNSLNGVNDFADDVTYRLSGKVDVEGLPRMNLSTMLPPPTDSPIPAAIQLAGYLGDKMNRLFANPIQGPKVKSVDLVVDLLPERRLLQIDGAWISQSEVAAGETVTIKAFLRPFRGDRVEREIKLKIPEGMPKGEHRILLSDAEVLNQPQRAVPSTNRFLDLQETVSLINQERSNTDLYASLLQMRPTVYSEDKTMPNLPQSVVNIMQTGRSANRMLSTAPETVMAQTSTPFDFVVNGAYSLKILVR